MKKTNRPSNTHKALKLTIITVALAPDCELLADGLLPVPEAPPLPDCEGIVDGDELPALLVALPSARRTT